MDRTGSLHAPTCNKTIGPWPCEACGKLSQYANTSKDKNMIYCRNESCGYRRIVDKRKCRIVENDGTVWGFDNQGNKWPMGRVAPL